jgi:LDH2 family malate/lactate/ureidoglycolate dehydrogenase
VAIDLAAFGDVAEFKARVDRLVGDLRSGERMPGVERIWLPGEQSHERRVANLRDGIALPPALLAQLHAFAAENCIAPLATTTIPKETT